jgi:hypothetical protein
VNGQLVLLKRHGFIHAAKPAESKGRALQAVEKGMIQEEDPEKRPSGAKALPDSKQFMYGLKARTLH